MLQQLFGTELSSPMRLVIAIVVIAALLGITIALIRRMGSGSRERFARGGRSGPRLALVDAIAVDQRRRLVLVRRDSTEHLLLIGGTADVVVESQIPVDEEEVEAAREALPGRPARRAVAAAPAAEAISAPEPAAPRIAPAAAAPAIAAPAAAGIGAAIGAVPADEPPAEAERPALRRRPAPRGDGTLSGQPRPGEIAPEPLAPPPGRVAPPLGAPVIGAPREREPAFALPAATTVVAGETRTRVGAGYGAAARSDTLREPPKVEARPESRPEPRIEPDANDGKLDEMARRLDAALGQGSEPPAAAAPQLNLSDLLGELAEPADATPADAAKAETKFESTKAESPKAEPPKAAPGERPVAPAAERPLGRPVRTLRPPPVRPAVEPRAPRLDMPPRIDLPPRGERAALPGFATQRTDKTEAAAQAVRAEPALKLREFSLRTSDVGGRAAPEPAPSPAVVAPVAAVVAAAAVAEAIAPAVAAPEKPVAPEPGIKPFAFSETYARPHVPAAEPTLEAEAKIEPDPEAKHDEIKVEVSEVNFEKLIDDMRIEAPEVAPEPKAEEDVSLALDDFDAEMASLLGRTSARR